MQARTRIRGFTLIELSIVLVVIGLIVGGILVGQDLIRAAEVRAQITQIEKYNSAVNTFRGKFNAIPGDMNVATAQQYGFNVSGCDGSYAKRDGNNLIDSIPTSGSSAYQQGYGETALFWADLSTSGFISGTYPNSGAVIVCTPPIPYGIYPNNTGFNAMSAFFPNAKIGNSNYIYVYDNSGVNWFSVSTPANVSVNGTLYSTPGIKVVSAYAIDKKIDDGIPNSGNVMTLYLNNSPGYGTQVTDSPSGANDTATTCYNTASFAYSIAVNSGSGANCALSFKFQ